MRKVILSDHQFSLTRDDLLVAPVENQITYLKRTSPEMCSFRLVPFSNSRMQRQMAMRAGMEPLLLNADSGGRTPFVARNADNTGAAISA